MRIKVSELGMELKMHLEITNSQRFHQYCCLSSDLVSAGQSSPILTAVLESGVVIVEGVTSLLIDKGGKKNPFLRRCFHLYDSGYTYSVITACRLNQWALGVCESVCALSSGMSCLSVYSSTGLT